LDAAISTRSSLTAPNVRAEVDAGIAAVGLTGTITGRIDAAVSSRSTYAGADTPGTTTLLGRITNGDIQSTATRLLGMTEIDGPVYRFTINSLEQAPAGGGGGGGGLTLEQDAKLTDIHTRTSLITPGDVTIATPVSLEGNLLTLRAGDAWPITLDGLGSLAGRTKLWFSIYADNGARLLTIEETEGVQVISRAKATDPAGGTLSVLDETTGNLNVAVSSSVSGKLSANSSAKFSVKWRDALGDDRTAVVGDCVILPELIEGA
jgi:hypothetical protein